MCGTHRHRHLRVEHDERHDPRRSTHTAGGGTGRLPADHIRASDAEREALVAELRAHATDGRLGVEELERRVETAYGATTRAELAALTTDLPRAPRPQRSSGLARAALREHVRAYLMVMALLVAIWLLTGAGYPWPVWPALGWGFGLLSHASTVRPARRMPHART